MRMIWALGAALVLSTSAAFAVDSFSGPEGPPNGVAPPPHRSLYERIQARYGHMNKDVEEEFRDGPCRIERYWERDGDFDEHIKCRPRD